MSDRQAQAHLRRVVSLFARYGTSFTLLRGGESQNLRGLFAPMDIGTTATYFDANESVGLLRPALSLYLDGAQTNPPVANDTFTYNNRLWTVRKTHTFWESDTAMLLLALCD